MLEENKLKIEEKEADRIITTGNPERFQLLRVKSNECSLPLVDSDRDIISNMQRIMDEMGELAGGIAAVQVGFPRRIFIMRESETKCLTVVNPKIVKRSSAEAKKAESCLSIPNTTLMISRPKEITLEFYDEDGAKYTRKFTHTLARIVCHEMDHLNGKLLDAHMAELAKAFQKKKEIRLVERALKKRKNRKKRKRK
jgi:peptide deformylase